MKKNIKVLQLIGSLTAGGKERQFVELLKGLSKQKGINCEVVIMSKEIHYKELFNLNIKINYLIKKWKIDFRLLCELYRLCKEVNPDVIHTWDNTSTIYAIPIAKILNIRLLNGSIRGAFKNIKKFSKVWLMRRVFTIFSHLTVANSYAGLKCYNVISTKGSCVYNGFDFGRIKNIKNKKDIKSKYNIRTDRIVGMVAGFRENKNYKHYILAAKNILARRRDVTFLAIGDGPSMAKHKELHKELIDRSNNFKFISRQSDVESIVNIFNVGILTTNTLIHGEGIANVIMEYMALGKPVIATDNGGTRELVIDNITGFLVQDNDVEELVKKIELLLDDERIAREMGVAGHLRIKEQFNLNKMTSSYISLYHKIVAS